VTKIKFIKIIIFVYLFLISHSSLSSEIEILSDTPGIGKPVINHSKITVNYRGYLEDSTEFDSSFKRNEPFKFQIGVRKVIPGWEFGLLGMREGGKRTIKIPPNYAYGKNGVPGVIPPNSTLFFDIELISVEPPGYKLIDFNSLNNSYDYLIIDIRSKKEWIESGIIENSKTITAFDNNGNFIPGFLESINEISSFNTNIVFVSKHGDISSLLANGFVEQLGYENVFSLQGGIMDLISNNVNLKRY